MNSKTTSATRLLEALAMPDWMIRCVAGHVPYPKFSFDSPCDFRYGFPPAFLPIWSKGSPSYIGVLHHWLMRRATTFVDFDIESKAMIEIARTPEQLRVWVVFDLLRNMVEQDQVALFAESVGLCAPHELECLFAEYYEPEDLAKYPAFTEALPRSLVKGDDKYSGDFPSRPEDLWRSCEFEVSRKVLAQATTLPPWYRCKDQPDLFGRLLAANDLEGAWLCLNSSGWGNSEMKAALEQLRSHCKLEGLSLLSDFVRVSTPDIVGY